MPQVGETAKVLKCAVANSEHVGRVGIIILSFSDRGEPVCVVAGKEGYCVALEVEMIPPKVVVSP